MGAYHFYILMIRTCSYLDVSAVGDTAGRLRFSPTLRMLRLISCLTKRDVRGRGDTNYRAYIISNKFLQHAVFQISGYQTPLCNAVKSNLQLTLPHNTQFVDELTRSFY